jgi:diaminobutyrate-2-oxoglutarate transaminase
MVLAGHASDTLGVVMTIGALGAVAGALILAGFNLKKNLMLWVLCCDAALAFFVILAGFGSSAEIWAVSAFGAFVAGGISEGCAGALWMRKAPKESQGSIFAAVGTLNLIVLSVVLLFGSALADNVLEPLMMPGTSFSETFGPWLGVGKGRGIALLFVAVGSLFFIISIVAMANSRLRNLDDLVRDQSNPDEENDSQKTGDEVSVGA